MTSLVTESKAALDTPVLCIDWDAMERNIQRMARYMADRGKQWRPHLKCHKTPEIAHQVIAAGAIGLTCAKLSEAEVMAKAGIEDLLIANMVVGPLKVGRAAQLCHVARPIIACDHYAQVTPLAEACQAEGVTCRLLIEVNIGLDRVGVSPGKDTIELAEAISKLKGVELAGIMGYEGHLLRIVDQDEKRTKIAEAIGTLVDTAERIRQRGISCEIVSAGGTGSYQITADLPGVTELQAGGGIFADPFYLNQCQVKDLEPSLTVLATVVSRPTRNRAILDCGRKTHYPDLEPPIIKGYPDAKVTQVSAEHCTLELSGPAQELRIGDRVELHPGYADFTTVLHNKFYACRGDEVAAVWDIAARGCLQ